ncbi:MAG TPA: hypothetical protein VF469_09700 [Kofleriaceae bacterium]
MRTTWVALAVFAFAAFVIARTTSDLGIDPAGPPGTGTVVVTGILSGLTVGLSEPIIGASVTVGTAAEIEQARAAHPETWMWSKIVGTLGLLALVVWLARKWSKKQRS